MIFVSLGLVGQYLNLKGTTTKRRWVNYNKTELLIYFRAINKTAINILQSY